MPRVSAVIPVYKSKQYVEKAVDSVLAQSVTDLELIVVDDGCPEGTGKLVEERYCGEPESRVRVIFKENGGPATARNRGIEESRGEWVAFLDSDDWWEPEKLEVQLRVAEEHPEYGLIASSYYKFEGGRTFERTRHGPSGSVFREIYMGNYIRTSTVMIRRDCFEKVGLFDIELPLTQDYDMWMRMAHDYEVGYVNRPLATYRWHEGGISRKVLASREYFLEILQKNYDSDLIPESLYRKRIGYIHFHIARHCRGADLAEKRREHLREAVRLCPLKLSYRFALWRA